MQQESDWNVFLNPFELQKFEQPLRGVKKGIKTSHSIKWNKIDDLYNKQQNPTVIKYQLKNLPSQCWSPNWFETSNANSSEEFYGVHLSLNKHKRWLMLEEPQVYSEKIVVGSSHQCFHTKNESKKQSVYNQDSKFNDLLDLKKIELPKYSKNRNGKQITLKKSTQNDQKYLRKQNRSIKRKQRKSLTGDIYIIDNCLKKGSYPLFFENSQRKNKYQVAHTKKAKKPKRRKKICY